MFVRISNRKEFQSSVKDQAFVSEYQTYAVHLFVTDQNGSSLCCQSKIHQTIQDIYKVAKI